MHEDEEEDEEQNQMSKAEALMYQTQGMFRGSAQKQSPPSFRGNNPLIPDISLYEENSPLKFSPKSGNSNFHHNNNNNYNNDSSEYKSALNWFI